MGRTFKSWERKKKDAWKQNRQNRNKRRIPDEKRVSDGDYRKDKREDRGY